MTRDDISIHVDEIINFLSENTEKKVERKELEKELKKFIEYGVPIDQAKQTLIKKFGGGLQFSSQKIPTERILLSDLQANQSNVSVLCRVITINPKEITTRGEQKQIYFGILGDESGTIQFTAWNDIEVEKGDVIEISNAYTREWRGEIQLNLGDRVTISKTDKSKLPESAFKPKQYKINDLRPGLGEIEITGKILEIEKKENETADGKKINFFGIIADETGKIQFTAWHDFKLKKEDVVTISGGYIRSWKGIPQISFDERSQVTKQSKNLIKKDSIQTSKVPMHVLVERGGAFDIIVEGTIIEIQAGSGLIKRCSECNRVLWNDECKIHGKNDGIIDMRIKLVADDGTGAVNVVLNKDLSEEILDIKFDDYKKLIEDDNNNDVIKNEIESKLFTKRLQIQGNAMSDDFGTTIIAKKAEVITVDLQNEIEKVLSKLEELE